MMILKDFAEKKTAVYTQSRVTTSNIFRHDALNWKVVQRKRHIKFDETEKSLFGENEAVVMTRRSKILLKRISGEFNVVWWERTSII